MKPKKKTIITLQYKNGEYFKLGANTGLRAEAINMTIAELNLQNTMEDWS